MVVMSIIFVASIIGYTLAYIREGLLDTELPIKYAVYRIKGYKKSDACAFSLVACKEPSTNLTLNGTEYVLECVFEQEKTAQRYIEHWEN